jgi:UDP-glucose 4-epimerase
LVTGAAGFIGSHMAEALLERGHDVIGVDNLLTGRRENFPDVFYWDVEGGLRKVPGMNGEPADVIVHCAASYDDRDHWRRDIHTNVLGAEAVCRSEPKRIVYFQTALCYGHNPYGGADPWPLVPEWPLAPDNSYAISKTAGEQYIQHSGIPYVSLRLANVYGPRNLSGPIPTFYKRISEGERCTVVDSRRDFVFIDDLLGVAIPAVEGHGQGVYHVSSGTDYPIRDVFQNVAFAMGAADAECDHTPRPPGDSPSILLDPTQTEIEFEWKPTVGLEEGIAAAVGWYREHGVERTFTHLAVGR